MNENENLLNWAMSEIQGSSALSLERNRPYDGQPHTSQTDQGQIRLTENCNHGIVMTVDDDESQSKASMTIETAKRFAKELNTIIERIEK